jgi:hypothetical protein
MSLRQILSTVAVKCCVFCVVAGGLTLAGCTSDTLPESASRAGQIESAQKGVDQSAKSRSGKKTGPPIMVKSVKAMIKKGPQE